MKMKVQIDVQDYIRKQEAKQAAMYYGGPPVAVPIVISFNDFTVEITLDNTAEINTLMNDRCALENEVHELKQRLEAAAAEQSYLNFYRDRCNDLAHVVRRYETEKLLVTYKHAAVEEEIAAHPGNKIAAIKGVRTRVACGLKEAKDMVDYVVEEQQRSAAAAMTAV